MPLIKSRAVVSVEALGDESHDIRTLQVEGA
jgi:hypothetical protein